MFKAMTHRITVKTAATLLLFLMVALFLIGRELNHFFPHQWAWGFLIAFSEAAMVGGLADWFAVTALFRHPLGLPFPHTALIPHAKDRIAVNLADFIETHFLRSIVLARRLKPVDAGLFLLRLTDNKITADQALRHRLRRFWPQLWQHIDYPAVSDEIATSLLGMVRKSDPTLALGDVFKDALEKKKQVALITSVLQAFANWLAHHEDMIRDMVSERSGSFLRWTGLDHHLADSIYDAVNRLVNEMMVAPDHPLRLRFDKTLWNWAEKLGHDPAFQKRFNRIKNALLDNPAARLQLQSKIENGLQGFLLKSDATEILPVSSNRRFPVLWAEWGQAVTEDRQTKAALNRLFRRIIIGVIVPHSHQITRLITDTVEKWDGDEVAGRIEKAVGGELHYIRLSGTFVGGAIGLLLHAASLIIG
ncbi:DUF445 domain-containing protein [Zymomonas mobilis subsp. mobilis ZM4 = ATCC 31821]|uniref:DUF445 domain-containing protein n=2 Tax=Zymomonas mobilis TaxID=542 RepID=Q5NQU0_ZYMMO|nr:protein of unknown function DUF445 [Zymomonas mobilis subsp. mobilis ZM4 = ATCC 31821]AVZ25287.1 DUF445 domain-containing protein [Zymomonas mobilis subsp. mobilis]AVZ27178.1 DUF445 domain-containing protein [Zymomonas mobilis subsp. mobilis]AVZ41624.1 DUF445 domain-containing protein [Zymomonas mobilis subsp. mobilis ZM4 = ATCC 31821]HCE37856.1 DUF445 domain-containing protein [Zymomonas mobilis]